MAARALWNGTLHAGKLSLPVQLFSAAQDRHVAFHLLHAKDRTRVEQRMVRPDTAEPVPRERIRRGVEAEPGVFVLVEKDELASLEPPASRDLRADRFLPLGTVPAAALDRPYWLGPGKGASHERYFALAEALEGKGREATVAWVMRKRHYRGVLRAQDGYLVLTTVRLGATVVRTEDLAPPAGERLEARELAMARQLLEHLEGSYDPAEFEDTYRARVEQLIDAKAAGKRTTVRKFRPKPTPTRDLTRLLETSLRHATRNDPHRKGKTKSA